MKVSRVCGGGTTLAGDWGQDRRSIYRLLHDQHRAFPRCGQALGKECGWPASHSPVGGSSNQDGCRSGVFRCSRSCFLPQLLSGIRIPSLGALFVIRTPAMEVWDHCDIFVRICIFTCCMVKMFVAACDFRCKVFIAERISFEMLDDCPFMLIRWGVSRLHVHTRGYVLVRIVHKILNTIHMYCSSTHVEAQIMWENEIHKHHL